MSSGFTESLVIELRLEPVPLPGSDLPLFLLVVTVALALAFVSVSDSITTSSVSCVGGPRDVSPYCWAGRNAAASLDAGTRCACGRCVILDANDWRLSLEPELWRRLS